MQYRREALDDISMHSRPSDSPVREFAWLAFSIFLIIALAMVLISAMSTWLSPKISLSTEQKILNTFGITFDRPTPNSDEALVEAYLSNLLTRLTPELNAPVKKLHLHYSTERDINAYATLAGHIVIYQGILTEVKSENELAMVLAHEAAHVQYRHPITGIVRSSVLAGASLLLGNESNISGIVGNTTLLSSLQFSRSQEQASDAFAIAKLKALYGHCAGAGDFFANLQQHAHTKDKGIELFNTHPSNAKRIRMVNQACSYTSAKTRTPIPKPVAAAIYRLSVAKAPPLKEKPSS